MSKRRKIGDRVWIVKYAGFGASQGEWATIIDWKSNHDYDICLLDCDDEECREWADVMPEAGNDKRMFYHVSECEMFDAPQQALAQVGE